MSKEIESVASALFDKIRSRFPGITLGDEKAKATSDPENARFFNFTYAGKDGAQFGTVTISLIDETSLKVYFGQNISGEMDREQRQEWYTFLRNLRQFAKRNLLTFDTRDINKSNLELQDIKQQAKTDDVATVSDIAVTESKLYGTPGRPYNSFADKGATKILIRHQAKVDEEVRGSRSRKIQEIFLETERGERFLLNHTNLHGAYAMAEHLNAGGSMYDEIAEHINGLVTEMASMKHFVRSTKHRQFEDEETADMTRAAVHHYDKIKRTLRMMRGARGYRSYFETFSPAENPLEDIDVDALRERFVKKVYDDRFTEALPIVYKAYKKYKAEAAGQLGDELAEWAEDIAESAWDDDTDQVDAIIEFLKTACPLGIDGIDASTELDKLVPLFGPEIKDELADTFATLAGPGGPGPDHDATTEIKAWLQNHKPELYSQVQQALASTGRDQQTNFAQPTSPKQDNHEYGSQPSHPNVSNVTREDSDPLMFIRSLAGLAK